MNENDSRQVISEIKELISGLNSLQLATLSSQGNPEASYTPFIYEQPCLYIFISKLASHTGNLFNHPDCSALLIEDECKSTNIHARKRLTLKCQALNLPTDHTDASNILDVMETRLGKTMKMLRTLPDFCLFQLKIQEGRYVRGFGAAYKTNASLSTVELVQGR